MASDDNIRQLPWVDDEPRGEPPPVANLIWIDNRWHLYGKPVHAGETMELLTAEGIWLPVRIESRDSGRKLDAYTTVCGRVFRCRIYSSDELRWPVRG